MEALLLAFFQSQWSLDDVLADVVFLGEIEELANVAGAFRSETTWNVDVGQSGNFLLAFANDNQRQSREVGIDDASANGFTFALSGTTWTIARMSFLQEQADTGWNGKEE